MERSGFVRRKALGRQIREIPEKSHTVPKTRRGRQQSASRAHHCQNEIQ